MNFSYIECGLLFFCDRDWYLVVYMLGYKILMICVLFCLLVVMGLIFSEEIGLVFGYLMIGVLDNNLIMNFIG